LAGGKIELGSQALFETESFNHVMVKGREGTLAMATNTGKDHRNGAVKERIQVKNPLTKQWVKIDTTSGRILDAKKTPGPYKGIEKRHK
jgi:hypothetical protein